MLIMIVMFSVTIVSIYMERFNWLSFVMSFLWGFQDGGMNVHTMQTLGFEFGENNGEPFGVMQLVQGIATCSFGLIQGTIDVTSQKDLVIYLSCCCAIGIMACVLAYIFPYKCA